MEYTHEQKTHELYKNETTAAKDGKTGSTSQNGAHTTNRLGRHAKVENLQEDCTQSYLESFSIPFQVGVPTSIGDHCLGPW